MPVSIRKRVFFNRLNFLGILVSIACFGVLMLMPATDKYAAFIFCVGSLMCSVIPVCLMLAEKDKIALLFSLLVYPLLMATKAVYIQHSYLLYYLPVFGLITFFFLNNIRNITVIYLYNFALFAAGTAMLAGKDAMPFDIFTTIVVFSLLYLLAYNIKWEMRQYFKKLQQLKTIMNEKNVELEKQKIVSEMQAVKLEERTTALSELNELKTKIFLKVGDELGQHVYSANALIKQLETMNDPFVRVKTLMPRLKIKSDHSVQLLENILSWSKTLMKLSVPKPQSISVGHVVRAAIEHCNKAANAKGIDVVFDIEKSGLHAWADRDMMEVAVKGVVADAIKNAYPNSTVAVSALRHGQYIKVQVVGLGTAGLEGYNENTFAAQEFDNAPLPEISMELMLSKELMEKNNCIINITTCEGPGMAVELKIPLQATFL